MVRKICAWFLILFLALMPSVLFAAALQQPAAPAAPAAVAPASLQLPGLPPINLGSSWWAGILMGIFSGAQAVVFGFLKNRDPQTGKLPAVNWTMAAETLGVGALLGIIAHLIHWAPQDLASWLQTTPIGGFVVTGVESVLNMIFRHGVPALAGALALFKSGASGNPTPPGTK